MPYIQLDVPNPPSEPRVASLAQTIAELYAEVMQTDSDGVTVAVRELGSGRVLRAGRPVVAVRCDIRSGRRDAQRETFAARLTRLIEQHGEQLGSGESVIYFTEGPGRFIFEDGQPNPDWTPEEAVG